MRVIENVNNKLVIKFGYIIKIKNMFYNKCLELSIQEINYKTIIVFKIM